jgi:DNA-binding NarL/FixJ family response regulator
MMESYRIVLADDHALFRRGMRKIINEVPGMEVIAEANDGLELLEMLRKLMPDLVVLDISMPNLRGIEAAREIRTHYPRTKVLILTMHKNKEYLYHAIASGASGYLLKEDSDEELLLAIETICKGGTYVTQKLAGTMAQDLSRAISGKDPLAANFLTSREREILKFIVKGKTSSEIAVTLNISARTVETHRANIMKKLNLKKTAELVRYAVDHGLI